MKQKLTAHPLTPESFARYGQIIEMRGDYDFTFNDGRADRWADLMTMECDEKGRIGVSLCTSRPLPEPYEFQFVERHPLASQAFIPLDNRPFFVIVAPRQNPDAPEIFLTNGAQGINYAAGTWHGVLSPIGQDQNFLIIDRVAGDGDNLEIHSYAQPFTIAPPHKPSNIPT